MSTCDQRLPRKWSLQTEARISTCPTGSGFSGKHVLSNTVQFVTKILETHTSRFASQHLGVKKQQGKCTLIL